MKSLEFAKKDKPFLNDCSQIKLDKDDCITAVTVYEKDTFLHGLGYTTVKGKVSSVDFFDNYQERLPYVPGYDSDRWFAKSFFFNGQKTTFENDDDVL